MNKKDIDNIRKQYKLNNDLLTIREIFNVYVQKESGDIYHGPVGTVKVGLEKEFSRFRGLT